MRIAKASVEMATAPRFDHIILNDNLEEALIEAENLVLSHISKPIFEDVKMDKSDVTKEE
jgi:guanylate kinase